LSLTAQKKRYYHIFILSASIKVRPFPPLQVSPIGEIVNSQLYYLHYLKTRRGPVAPFRSAPASSRAAWANQLAHPALGQAEIPRKPHRRAWLAANDANLHFAARRKFPRSIRGAVIRSPRCPLM
jgi:hypothetical protein